MIVIVMRQLNQLIHRIVNYHLAIFLHFPQKQGEALTITIYQKPGGDMGLGLHAQLLVEKVLE